MASAYDHSAFAMVYDHARYLMGIGGLDLRSGLSALLIGSDSFDQSAASLAEELATSTECTANGASRQSLSGISVVEGSGYCYLTSDPIVWTASGGVLGGAALPYRLLIYKSGASDSLSVPIISILLSFGSDGPMTYPPQSYSVTIPSGQSLTMAPHPVRGWACW